MSRAHQMLIDGSFEESAVKPAALDKGELKSMMAEMEKQDGLLNFAQAATLLCVSRPRVYQLVSAGILKRYTFCGHHYVSVKEVRDRLNSEIKNGRPKRNVIQRTKLGVKAALQTDRVQLKQGGYAGHQGKSRK